MRKCRSAYEVPETPYYDVARADGTHSELATCGHSVAANAAHHGLIAASEVDHYESGKILSFVEESGCHSCDSPEVPLEGQVSVVASCTRSHLVGMTEEEAAKHTVQAAVALPLAQE